MSGSSLAEMEAYLARMRGESSASSSPSSDEGSNLGMRVECTMKLIDAGKSTLEKDGPQATASAIQGVINGTSFRRSPNATHCFACAGSGTPLPTEPTQLAQVIAMKLYEKEKSEREERKRRREEEEAWQRQG